MKITVLGIGLMGAPMTRRLLAAGHAVTVWNRTAAKAQALVADGARAEATAGQAVKDADIVVTMLENGDIVADVLFQPDTLEHLPNGALLVDMSSIRPDQAITHARRLSNHGVRHLDAPVSGGTVGAEAGTLAIMVGGSAEDHEHARPLFAALGRATHVGPSGAGQFAKLANQIIVGVSIAAVAEALLLAQRGGADMGRVREAIRGGFAESRVLEVHGARMVDRDFAKRAAIDVQLKDLRNALTAARSLGFAAPVTAALEALFGEASAHGLGDLDQAAILLELEARNTRAPAP